MPSRKFRPFASLAFLVVLVLFFIHTAGASVMDSIGTGSMGSYSHGAKKSEGSKTKAPRMREDSVSKSYSHGHGKGHGASGKCPFSHLLRFKEKLGLTGSQVAKIKDMRHEYNKSKILNKAQKQIAKMDLNRLAHKSTLDEVAIRAAGEKIVEIKSKMIRAKVEAKIGLLKVLTPEQREKSQQMHH